MSRIKVTVGTDLLGDRINQIRVKLGHAGSVRISNDEARELIRQLVEVLGEDACYDATMVPVIS